MTAQQLKWLSYLTCMIMFLALMGGAVVTKTGSGLECGNEWPLCNGKLVPAYTLGSLIEYTHRLFSGLAGLASLASMYAFWRYARERRDLLTYAFMTLLFVIVQGGMGALAVVKSQSAAVMALHMGFSLIAFASSLMLALGSKRRFEDERSVVVPPVGRLVSRGFRNLVWITTIYSYIVVYIGAYVSHTDSRGGCSGWPLCNGEWIPELTGGVGIVFAHRIAAAILFILIAILGHLAFWRYKEHRELRSLGVTAVLLCLMQVLSGAAVVYTLDNDRLYIFAALAHILLIAGLFGVLCYLSVRVWQLSRRG